MLWLLPSVDFYHLYSLSHLSGVQPDAATEMSTAGAFLRVTIFCREHTCFLRVLLMAAEDTKQMGVGIQHKM